MKKIVPTIILSVIVLSISLYTLYRTVTATPVPVFDQLELVSYQFRSWFPYYYHSITLDVLIGFINLIIPFDPLRTNMLVRFLAGGLFLTASFLLARCFKNWVLFYVLMLTSTYALSCISTDIFAAGFVTLFFWSYLSKKSKLLTLFFLMLFTFCKPDLLLPGLLMGSFFFYQEKIPLKTIAFSIGIFLLILVPSIYLNPPSDRAFISFSQHYAVLVSEHQLTQAPDPWLYSGEYTQASFGEAKSIFQILLSEPGKYLDFLLLSVSRSIQEAAFTNMLFLIIYAGIVFSIVWRNAREISMMVLLLLSDMFPILALSFLDYRYQARFYPAFLILVFTAIQFDLPLFRLKAIRFLLILLLVFQIARFGLILWNGYW